MFTWFRGLFSCFSRFSQIVKVGIGTSYWGINSVQRLNYLILPFVFQFQKCEGCKSCVLSFQCILHNSTVHSPDFLNFIKVKRGDLFPWGQLILQNGSTIWSLFLYFNFKNFKEPNSLSFVRFQFILHDSEKLFSVPEIKEGEPNSLVGETNSAERLNYLVPSSVFQFWKFKWPKLLVIHLIFMYSTWSRSAFLLTFL